MSRPRITAELLATLTESVPQRIAKRLDAAPRSAEAWSWAGTGTETATDARTCVVTTEGGEHVTLSGPQLSDVAHVTCTCLLAPRCFHVLAVVTVLPIFEATAFELAALEPSPASSKLDGETLDDVQRAAAARAGALGAVVLAGGLLGVSTLRRGELLRAIHEARRAALPRLERALLAVLEDARALRDKDSNFSIRRASASLAELLSVTRRISRGEATAELVGVARQEYRPRANLLVTGLATEPILAAGYAGVVSYFTDGERVFSAAEMVPGDDERAVAAIDAQLRFGEVSLIHREVQCSSLRFATARISDEGRLGAGKDVVAARASYDGEIIERWLEKPLAAQLDVALASALVCVAGTMTGPESPVLLLRSGEVAALVPAIDHPRFAFRENLSRLAAASLAVRLVAHVSLDGARATLRPIAAFPMPGASHTLSAKMNLGFERLRHAEVPRAHAHAILPAHPPSAQTPLRALETRVFRMAMAGAQSLPGAAHPQVIAEARAMRANLLPTLSAVHASLGPATARGPEALAEAWLAAHLALCAAERVFARASLSV